MEIFDNFNGVGWKSGLWSRELLFKTRSPTPTPAYAKDSDSDSDSRHTKNKTPTLAKQMVKTFHKGLFKYDITPIGGGVKV